MHPPTQPSIQFHIILLNDINQDRVITSIGLCGREYGKMSLTRPSIQPYIMIDTFLLFIVHLMYHDRLRISDVILCSDVLAFCKLISSVSFVLA